MLVACWGHFSVYDVATFGDIALVIEFRTERNQGDSDVQPS